MTINDVMEKLNLDKNTAYGFLKFMEKKGLVKGKGHQREPGVRGKGLKLYELSASAASDLAGFLATLNQ